MKPLKILGVFRDPKFSNNAIEADRLILQESLARIEEALGSSVKISFLEEGEIIASARGTFDLVLTMAQSEEALIALENAFPNVWNSSAAIRNCYRKNMSETLIRLPVNYVPFQILPTDGTAQPKLEAGQAYWLKRSDFHAISDEDVSLAETSAEAESKLEKFRTRGVREVILQKHVVGDIYKFYGVEGKFFRPIRVRNFLNQTKEPDFTSLERAASQSARALGVVIYGGDAILDADGIFHLIDLNDWPSFRICRPDASQAIASLVIDRLHSAQQKAPAVSGSCL